MKYAGQLLLLVLLATAADSPNANSTIRARFHSSDIVITTTSRLAGAIHSLTWNAKEFIDSDDHGRQLQSAAGFNLGNPGPFNPECYNPTEAGARDDGAGPLSTSHLLSLTAHDADLQTTTQMAFWLAPGEKSGNMPALNTKKLSDHILTKHVHIGYKNLPNVLDYQVTFTVPKDEHNTFAQFEALTGYMPPDFSRFRKFLPTSGSFADLDDGPGEQPFPVVLATEDGAYAMGVFSPGQPSPGFENAGYGRFRFNVEKVVKWNCVFREKKETGVTPGDYHYRMFVPIGTLEDVRQALVALTREFPRH